MSNYEDLMKQAHALMEQAEQARKAELATAIADIKDKMKQHGITVADLGGGRAGSKSKVASTPKYRGPNGELWSGGPGRKPQWVRDALAAGKNLDDFKI